MLLHGLTVFINNNQYFLRLYHLVNHGLSNLLEDRWVNLGMHKGVAEQTP